MSVYSILPFSGVLFLFQTLLPHFDAILDWTINNYTAYSVARLFNSKIAWAILGISFSVLLWFPSDVGLLAEFIYRDPRSVWWQLCVRKLNKIVCTQIFDLLPEMKYDNTFNQMLAFFYGIH